MLEYLIISTFLCIVLLWFPGHVQCIPVLCFITIVHLIALCNILCALTEVRSLLYTHQKRWDTCNFNFFNTSPLFKKGFLISLHFIHTIDRFVYNRCKFLKKQITVPITRFVTDRLQNFVRFITSLEGKKNFLWTLTNR